MDATQLDTPKPVRLSRRRFVQTAGAGSLILAVDSSGWLADVASSLELDGEVLTTTLLRPDDQLRLQLDFINLTHDAANNRLVASGTGTTPMMRVGLPRQHVSEQPVVAETTPPGVASAPIPHAVAANSRLVFEVAAPIDLTVDALLDLASHTLLTTTATGNPDDETTMVELPADLRWSPSSNVTARADIAPHTENGVSQLHRLFLEGPDGSFEFTPVHNASDNDGDVTRRIPDAGHRDSIVVAASNGTPALAERVWLTPHGAWADLSGDWHTSDGDGATISWIQNIAGGRDQFAQVIEEGVLMPFGIPAVWTETATRLWEVDADGDLVSTMVSEVHFAVTDGDEVTMPTVHAPADGRRMPFVSVRVDGDDNYLADKRTVEWGLGPSSLDPNDAWIPIHGGTTLWAGSDIRVSYVATDVLGQESSFSLAALFVRTAALDDTVVQDGLADFFGADEGDTFRRRSVGSDIAWAEPFEPGVGTTTQYTTEIEFDLEVVAASANDLAAAGELPVQPVVRRGKVLNESIGEEVVVTFAPGWLIAGNDETFNPTLAYLELDEPRPFPLGEESRAVMTPEMNAEEFNQTLGIGPVTEEVGAADVWRPEDAFGAAATILKGVKLSDLVGPVDFNDARLGIDIPTFDFQVFDDRLIQSYTWCPDEINSFEDAGFVTNDDTELCIEISSTIGLEPDVTTGVTVEFRVSDFTLVIPPLSDLVRLDIAELRGIQPPDGPADLKFDIEDWSLGGLLSFLGDLFKKFTPAGSAFDVDIDSSNINLDLDLPLPNIDLGVLSIKNFSVGLGGSFPYAGDDDPSIEIAVGTKRNPVDISILQFGGGFRLELALNASGLQSLEIYAEVSARLVEIDIKVANAYCEVGVSAEFRLDDGGNVTFIGKLWMEASFSVLGIVGATLNITGKVKYIEDKEKLTFSGTIYWSVTALFTFSGSVPIGKIDFKLGDGQSSAFAGHALHGGGGQLAQADPATGISGSFGDVHSFATWNEYVDKFAPEP